MTVHPSAAVGTVTGTGRDDTGLTAETDIMITEVNVSRDGATVTTAVLETEIMPGMTETRFGMIEAMAGVNEE